MTEIFNILLYQPLFNILIFLYNIIPGHDLGIAIIILTIGIKLLLYPLGSQQLKAQKTLQDLQPELQKIKEKHKDNKEAQAKAIMDFYKKQKVNPFSSCLPILIQLPILIALYQVFINGLKTEKMNLLYSFIKGPEQIHPFFLNLVDLSQPNIILALFAAFLQFWQSKMVIQKTPLSSQTQPNLSQQKTGKGELQDMMQMMNKQMIYFFPFITFIIALKLPAALPLYWSINTLFTVVQQSIILKRYARIRQF